MFPYLSRRLSRYYHAQRQHGDRQIREQTDKIYRYFMTVYPYVSSVIYALLCLFVLVIKVLTWNSELCIQKKHQFWIASCPIRAPTTTVTCHVNKKLVSTIGLERVGTSLPYFMLGRLDKDILPQPLARWSAACPSHWGRLQSTSQPP